MDNQWKRADQVRMPVSIISRIIKKKRKNACREYLLATRHANNETGREQNKKFEKYCVKFDRESDTFEFPEEEFIQPLHHRYANWRDITSNESLTKSWDIIQFQDEYQVEDSRNRMMLKTKSMSMTPRNHPIRYHSMIPHKLCINLRKIGKKVQMPSHQITNISVNCPTESDDSEENSYNVKGRNSEMVKRKSPLFRNASDKNWTYSSNKKHEKQHLKTRQKKILSGKAIELRLDKVAQKGFANKPNGSDPVLDDINLSPQDADSYLNEYTLSESTPPTKRISEIKNIGDVIRSSPVRFKPIAQKRTPLINHPRKSSKSLRKFPAEGQGKCKKLKNFTLDQYYHKLNGLSNDLSGTTKARDQTEQDVSNDSGDMITLTNFNSRVSQKHLRNPFTTTSNSRKNSKNVCTNSLNSRTPELLISQSFSKRLRESYRKLNESKCKISKENTAGPFMLAESLKKWSIFDTPYKEKCISKKKTLNCSKTPYKSVKNKSRFTMNRHDRAKAIGSAKKKSRFSYIPKKWVNLGRTPISSCNKLV